MSVPLLMSRAKRRQHGLMAQGFTLVEMLVALVVLSLLLGLLVQMSTVALSATGGSKQKIEAKEHAHQVLDAIGADLSSIITQDGIPLLITSSSSGSGSTTTTNISFSFVTQTRGPAPSPNTSLSATASSTCRGMVVCYQLINGTLYRVGQPVAWNDINLVSKLDAPGDPTQGSQIGVNILRLDAVALLSDGTTVPILSALPSPGSTQTWASTLGGTLPANFAALNLARALNTLGEGNVLRVRAVTIGVAALDSQNYNLLSATGKLSSFSSAFNEAGTGETPVEQWNKALGISSNWSGIPKPALAAVQVLQATFSLPTN